MSRAEHFATSGELAAGLAHEIRNPLAGIAGVIEIVSRDLPPNSAARAVIKDAKEEALQINRILTELLDTARPKPPQFQVKDIAATAEHAVMFARQQAITKRIMIELDKGEEHPTSRSRSQPDQSGAAESAAECDSGHGQAGLDLCVTATRPRRCIDHRRRRRQRYSARDPAQHLPSLLHHQGTRHRLGSIAGATHRGIARWQIEVRSEVGKGTQFVIRLGIAKTAGE